MNRRLHRATPGGYRRPPHRPAKRPPRRAPAHPPPALFTRIVLGAIGDHWLDELPRGAELWPPPPQSINGTEQSNSVEVASAPEKGEMQQRRQA